MGLSTEPFRRAGLSVTLAELERLVMDAAERLLPLAHPANGRTELSAGEQDFLRRAGVDLADFSPRDEGGSSPLAVTAAEYAVLLASALPAAEFAGRIGVDESRVRQRITRHTLYGVRDGKIWRVPVFQLGATGHGLLPGLDRVVPHLYDAHLVEVAHWFLEPQADLEGADGEPMSPREWLLRGHDPRVVATVAEEF